jgi:hypothetical protein
LKGDHSDTHVNGGRDGSSALLAGFLKSENLLSDGLRKIDKRELSFVEEIILPALVDDPNEIVFGGSRIWQDSIDLAKD